MWFHQEGLSRLVAAAPTGHMEEEEEEEQQEVGGKKGIKSLSEHLWEDSIS